MAAPAASATLCAGAPLTAQPLTLALKASPFAWREQVDAPAAVAAPRPPNPNIRLLCVMILFGLSAAFAAPVFGFSLFSPPLATTTKRLPHPGKAACLGFGAYRGPRTMGNLLCRKKKRENAADSAIIHLHLRRKFPLSSSIDAAFFSKPPTRREGRARAQQGIIDRHHVNGGRGASEGDRG